ncbi:aspartyl-phosphate phosphatase Spo0E family protein [Cytobacillus firmus]|uniref:aspartyl-phosphate phosphatase Spo0E family protein n=1 Tax=Cytobacillus firmus TaxID=1399 RepID=UPI0018CDBDBA|nr:aspartyl-phosphate phosphatase Spo0E family protein [Cytobacillus firmus]MBG9450062.1 stage 0 sporulation regulatory protein E [Cytobacillus firmus]MBY6050595.1 aspartyl-phosphate phosphatase Spo0E family protein [Cytobacillus firmus]USK40417.1 aspartyl-phosphate phosphatase Spo0E family protein [Cytobacillus firmus]
MRYKRIQLLTEIQQKREKMIETARRNGMASQETVRCSQELDQLIFEYQCFIKREKEQKKSMRVSFREMILSWKKAVV